MRSLSIASSPAKFKRDLERGQAFEAYAAALLADSIAVGYPEVRVMVPLEPSPDFDFLVRTTGGDLRVECKLDEKSSLTDNFAFEVAYKGKPSGIWRMFDLMVIGTSIGAPVYVVNREDLIKILMTLVDTGEARLVQMGDGAAGLLVPRSVFLAHDMVSVVAYDDHGKA